MVALHAPAEQLTSALPLAPSVADMAEHRRDRPHGWTFAQARLGAQCSAKVLDDCAAAAHRAGEGEIGLSIR